MSFYLGTGGSGKIMHITKGSYTDTAMQGGILPDTVFHSDLPYITWKEIPCTRTDSAGLPNSLAAITISSVDANLIASNNYSWFFVCDGNVYSNCTIDYYPALISNTGNYGWGVWSIPNNNDSTSCQPYGSYTVFSFNAAYSSIRLFILNISNSDFIPIQTTTNDIVVAPGNISVKGIDLTDLKYLRRLQINSTDLVANTGSTTLQLIDGAHMTRTSIKSNSTKTTIGDGIYTLFDSSIGGNFIYIGQKQSITLPVVWNSNNSYTLTHSDYAGKYCVVRIFGAGNGIASSTLIISLDSHPETRISLFTWIYYYYYGGNVYNGVGRTQFFISALNGVVTFRKTYEVPAGAYGGYNVAYPELLITTYILQ